MIRSPLASRYEAVIYRESAYEILKQHAEKFESTKDDAKSDGRSAARAEKNQIEDLVGSMAKSAVRSIGSQLVVRLRVVCWAHYYAVNEDRGGNIMKAVYFEEGGASDILQYGDVNTPDQCGDDQVLVHIKAAGINPIDIKIRSAPERFPVSRPVIPGCDGAGIIETVGQKVRDFKPGDAVYFSQPGFNQRQGTYAEYVQVDASLLAMKPSSLTFEQAAAAPLALITAWEALYDRARITAGQTVLVHAGAGGVGHVAIQLAKLTGASVMTTVSNYEKAAFAERLGADKSINYTTQDVVTEVLNWTAGKGVDIAFDTVGPDVLRSCFNCVKPYGDVVTILQPAADTDWHEARKRNVRFSLEMMLTPVLLELEGAKQHQGEILRQCAELLNENKLTIELAKTFVLAEASAAQDFLEQNHPMGKIVLTL